ncbi:hypothetical protein ACJW30_11G176400 [Castanea mollissima]
MKLRLLMGLRRKTMRPFWFLTFNLEVVLFMFQLIGLPKTLKEKAEMQALQRLTETAEKAEMELSSLTQTSISFPFIAVTVDGPKHIDTTLTRVKFEELCSDLLDRL